MMALGPIVLILAIVGIGLVFFLGGKKGSGKIPSKQSDADDFDAAINQAEDDDQ